MPLIHGGRSDYEDPTRSVLNENLLATLHFKGQNTVILKEALVEVRHIQK